ncbi:hypothetical protein [Taklimakanibacter albus]|uniref:Uncharacterized protein n=1 Tax=Taklimakanibacter albus TaxID=2800327 RepID=A0ACC5QYM8_9HYPH|nr:hypothetical protein [Aestuariivirga sp. YIM B02566]MBK1865495.1 hypothetical protein [Aestuariivirga sp. YIM B02566]
MRRAVSRKTSEALSVSLTWLARWNSRLFWPTKKIGMMVAPEARISLAVNGAQGSSIAGPLCGRSLVETPPPGNMPMEWPDRS